MKPTFAIFTAAVLLAASSSAEAARGTASGSTLMLPPPSVSTAPPQTNPIGGIGTGQSVGGSLTNPITGQSFGALPGQPGSPAYDPNSALALPSLNNRALPLEHQE